MWTKRIKQSGTSNQKAKQNSHFYHLKPKTKVAKLRIQVAEQLRKASAVLLQSKEINEDCCCAIHSIHQINRTKLFVTDGAFE